MHVLAQGFLYDKGEMGALRAVAVIVCPVNRLLFSLAEK